MKNPSELGYQLKAAQLSFNGSFLDKAVLGTDKGRKVKR